MAEILLNGTTHEITLGWTLADLLQALDLDPKWVVAELNGDPLHRDGFASASLQSGDRLELVRPVAGG